MDNLRALKTMLFKLLCPLSLYFWMLLVSACQGQTSPAGQPPATAPVPKPANLAQPGAVLKVLPRQPGMEGRLTVSPKELALWKKRMHTGPYKLAGDAGPNTPGDWQRIREYADEFCKSPFDSGNSGDWGLDLWTGYDRTIDSLDQYPIWQGIKLEAAAFTYLVAGDQKAGHLAKQCLMRQIRMAKGAKRIGLDVGAWPWPKESNKKPTFEAGTKECTWLLRLALTYDYILPLLSLKEREEVVSYLRGSATYFARRAQKRFEECFPARAWNDYGQRIYLADPQGVRFFKPDPIYEPAEKDTPPAYGNMICTHVNADGSLGNPISRLAVIYNNRTAERMTFVLMAGLLSGDEWLVREAKSYQKEWLMFSVYPDGTYGEYERNGNYGNPSQGAMWYGALCLQSYILSADWTARRGDSTLYKMSTRDGAFNTVMPDTGKPKTLQLVLDRYADNCRGARPLYWGEVNPGQRIDTWNENEQAKFPTRYATWDPLLALANRRYKSPLYRRVYQRTEPGTMPYPATGYSSAGKVWLPWCGTGAEFPGWLFMYGEELGK